MIVITSMQSVMSKLHVDVKKGRKKTAEKIAET